MRVPAKLQKRDTVIDNEVLGAVETFKVPQAALPLLTPARCHPIVHVSRDPPVKMIYVELV
ncbi:hypothetical protein SBA_ch1_30570 [Sphingomonas bisphenolicum]|uniref:Uncharacterized protein n=1 Tax=Sphingomonas bisphenolicum TaxID=296544 RepID=A0ABM7G0G6_9SPHN|nr:hypothetical protein SBA_ch1_30570 [Sphingomonas bisphenolicum]